MSSFCRAAYCDRQVTRRDATTCFCWGHHQLAKRLHPEDWPDLSKAGDERVEMPIRDAIVLRTLQETVAREDGYLLKADTFREERHELEAELRDQPQRRSA